MIIIISAQCWVDYHGSELCDATILYTKELNFYMHNTHR